MLKEVCEEGIKEGMKKMNINLIKDKTITLEKGVEKLSISPQELKNRWMSLKRHHQIIEEAPIFEISWL